MQCYSGYQGTFVIPLKHLAYVNRLSGESNFDAWKIEKIEEFSEKNTKNLMILLM